MNIVEALAPLMVEHPVVFAAVFYALIPATIILPMLGLMALKGTETKIDVMKEDIYLCGSMFAAVLWVGGFTLAYLERNGEIYKVLFPEKSTYLKMMFLSHSVLLITMLISLKRRGIHIWTRFFSLHSRKLSQYIGIGIVLILTTILIRLLWEAYGGLFSGIKYEGPPAFSAKSRSDLTLSYLVYCVLVPIAEELYFRGMTLSVLRNSCRTSWAVVAVSVYFTFPHALLSYSLLPMIFVVGVIYALLYIRYESLLPAILVHALSNLLALI